MSKAQELLDKLTPYRGYSSKGAVYKEYPNSFSAVIGNIDFIHLKYDFADVESCFHATVDYRIAEKAYKERLDQLKEYLKPYKGFEIKIMSSHKYLHKLSLALVNHPSKGEYGFWLEYDFTPDVSFDDIYDKVKAEIDADLKLLEEGNYYELVGQYLKPYHLFKPVITDCRDEMWVDGGVSEMRKVFHGEATLGDYHVYFEGVTYGCLQIHFENAVDELTNADEY